MVFSDTSSVSFSDFLSTVTSSIGLNKESTKREAEATTISIHNACFLVSNLQGVNFSDASGKLFTVSDPAHHHVDLTYFNFRSVVLIATVDICAPELFGLSSWLPQSLCTSTSHSPLLLKTLVDPVLVTIPPKLIDNLSFKLGNVSDDILSEMEVDQIQILLMDADGIISSAALNPSVFFQPSNFFLYLSLFPCKYPHHPLPLKWTAFVLLLLPLGLLHLLDL